LYIHSLTNATEDFAKLYRAVRNNYPHLLPQAADLRQRINYLSDRGIILPGSAIPHLTLASIPSGVGSHFHFFTGKLAKAFYYKHFGKPAEPDIRIITHWTNNQQPGVDAFLESVVRIEPFIEIGTRSNHSLGSQFAYRVNFSPDHNVMLFTASFNNQIIMTGLCAHKSFGIKFDDFLKLPSWSEPDLGKVPF